MEEDKIITLWSSDRESFTVSQELALESEILSCQIINNKKDSMFVDIESKILQKVIEYFERSTAEGMEGPEMWGPFPPDTPLNDWEKKFAKDVDLDMLHEIIWAGHDLSISGLVSLATRVQWDKLGVDLEQMRTNPDTLTVHQSSRRRSTFSVSTNPRGKNKRN